ncbi:MAG: hypothetical protein KC613_26830, partial [Myxococcales bacterium]|nr:hypothetical protein [Myxococcales bacterium]
GGEGGAGGAGGGAGDPCPTACATLADCAAQDEFCPGVSPGAVRDGLYAGCLESCAAGPALATVVNNLGGDCAQVVPTVSAASADFAAACEGGPRRLMCGGFVPRPSLPEPNAAACAACVDANCCAEATACGADESCFGLRECFLACEASEDAGCEDACVEEFAAGIEVNRPYITCRNTSCADECAQPPDWTCIGNRPAPMATVGDVALVMILNDLVSGARLAGATVKVCPWADPDCAAPHSEAMTDAEGTVSLTVPLGAAGFDGFFEISGGPAAPTLFIPNPPLVTERSAENPWSINMLGTDTLALFAQLAGAALDAERGHLGLIAIECNGVRAPGVQVSADTADAQSLTSYVAGGVPDANATATDRGGVAGIFNLPPGPVVLSATNADGGALSGPHLMIRAGYLTITNAAP